ncbi:uncharacterized protein LOC109840615 isoform X2 [Asparagus officinalis]|uniref:uncharacterized protein LOC109840615 isoform X2 n=1 Tax=Asparagus officinalis TaxID=4686 RepID=UPI00098DFA60|nr:uncharacterized protein LOC109840615 isoform X2 [Asparagus officinalis]
MGGKSSKLESPAATSTSSTPVTLNVYDLTPLNKYTYWCGWGIFHSGIEGNQIPRWVNRMAYFFGILCCCLLPKNLSIDAVRGELPYHGLRNAGSSTYSANSSVVKTESDSSGNGKSNFFPSPNSETTLIDADPKS